jgi:hypothetical protein
MANTGLLEHPVCPNQTGPRVHYDAGVVNSSPGTGEASTRHVPEEAYLREA